MRTRTPSDRRPGRRPRPGAGSLADCFLTAHGDNLLDVIAETLEDALEAEAEVEIRPFAKEGTYTYFVTGKE